MATDLKSGALYPLGEYRESLRISLLIKAMCREGSTMVYDRKPTFLVFRQFLHFLREPLLANVVIGGSNAYEHIETLTFSNGDELVSHWPSAAGSKIP